MKIELAKNERMAETGSSLLRLIQNQEMPILDLIVRESIQNSLDAGLKGPGYVDVEYVMEEFDSVALGEELEGIRKSFFRRHQWSQTKYLAICDKNTEGLTGPMEYNEVENEGYGNLFKLVYEINKPQSAAGSGGSWGLGKTVYFRTGVGLVIYYSRVKTASKTYQQRLVACLVEDETKSDALLENSGSRLRRGIAWWGEPAEEERTRPITNDEKIAEFLKIFNLEPYSGTETGTRIVIPFVDETDLMRGIIPEEQESDFNAVWTSSVEEYIKLAVQKWYAPRLANPNYSYGRWLRFQINGSGLRRNDFYPFFGLIQDLYNMTIFVEQPMEKPDDRFNVEDINLRDILDGETRAGQIAYVKADRELLRMDPPENNPNPYVFLNRFNQDTDLNAPIISYVRQPGMIVSYELNGPWTDSIPKTTDSEYIVGLFVLNSKNRVKRTEPTMLLEEYMRKSEKADHTSWHDWIGSVKLDIVTKISKNCVNKIKKRYTIEEPVEARRNIGLGKALADILLPPENFGTRPFGDGKKGAGDGSTGTSKLRLSLGAPEYLLIKGHRTLKFEFEIKWKKAVQSFKLELSIKSEASDIHANQWETKDGLGTPFPVAIHRFEVTTLKTGRQAPPYKPKTFFVDETQEMAEYDDIMMGVQKSATYSRSHAIEFVVPEKSDYVVGGFVELLVYDDGIMPGMAIYEIGGERK